MRVSRRKERLSVGAGANIGNRIPIARFGNLFVFRGTFNVNPPKVKARSLYHRAIYRKIYTAEPNIEEAIKLLSDSVAAHQFSGR